MQEQEISIFPERTVVYASFWERFGAWFIDTLIVIVFDLVLYYTMSGSILHAGLAPRLLAVVAGWLYFVLQESGPAQATLGKRAMGIKVTDMNGHRISFGQATGRYFGKIISGAILLIGYLMMLWDDKKQTLHDKMANTLVVINR